MFLMYAKPCILSIEFRQHNVFYGNKTMAPKFIIRIMNLEGQAVFIHHIDDEFRKLGVSNGRHALASEFTICIHVFWRHWTPASGCNDHCSVSILNPLATEDPTNPLPTIPSLRDIWNTVSTL